ncbi:MAG: hypothetical protein BroJett042_06490 [Bacteroidota bacterium]|nr:MAG: hypothetical protein UZ12_BCD005002441 [Bacteroidetes bacterium OLB12]GIL22136.1 MAG: hypothetical protein BroJett042_06490 [Bacteroidota bacterium]HNS31066.1 hypothetical protein [Tenuifilaceae bacterium]
MKPANSKQKLIKVTFEEEQQRKDLEFLKLTPAQRLQLHEIMRKRIWGSRYNKLTLKGLKVTKRKFE